MPTTPLAATHEAHGARFTDFGGWTMPLQYEGVVAEHTAVRSSCGVFDVSHLGRFSVRGEGATQVLLSQLCNNIERIDSGRAQYTMALNDAGGVEDDIIVWQLGPDDFWVMPNGVNSDEIIARFRHASGPEVTVDSVREATVLLAVQGPDARDIVGQCVDEVPGRFRVARTTYRGELCVIGGTGYTGEGGVEVAIAPSQAESLFSDLLTAGAAPCGLGARDTLRLEMGYPLWGQDLDEVTTPLEAGLGWVVAWDHDFVGREALERQKNGPLPQRLVAFDTGSRRIPRHGYLLRSGESTGAVTSGNFSPVLGLGIGMGYLSPPPDDDGGLEVEMRGEWQQLNRVDLPFIDR